MRSIGWSLPVLAMSILSLNHAQARAQEVFGGYVFPTYYAAPNVFATRYLTESSLVTPSFYLAPSYYETRFRRRGLFGRKLVETTRAYYVPTSAYYPTTYYPSMTFGSSAILEPAVMPTSFARPTSTQCCGEVVDTPIVTDVSASSEPARSTVALSPAAKYDRRKQPLVSSERPEHDSIPANLSELSTPQLPRRDRTIVRSTLSGPAVSAAPAPGAEVSRPDASAEGEELEPAPNQTAPRTSRQQSDSQRPVLATPRYTRPELRNILSGRVEARDTNEPEEGVRVSIANRQNASERREAVTNAFGRFAMRVPDGDWTVSVTMPSGRVDEVRQIAVRNGQITDEIGRDVPSLVITR